jgi:hypothetical protein
MTQGFPESRVTYALQWKKVEGDNGTTVETKHEDETSRPVRDGSTVATENEDETSRQGREHGRNGK